MKEYHVQTTINASPETIWKILIDAKNYPEWEPNITKLEGEIVLGKKVKVHTKISPGRAFPAKVTTLDAPQKMVWTGGMPLGLFKGERTFSLSSSSPQSTTFEMKEIFSGPLSPLIGKTIPDLTESFEQFAEGLKQRAENV